MTADNTLYYLRSILRQLQGVRDMIDHGPSLGGEVLSDNIDWLDCFIDSLTRHPLSNWRDEITNPNSRLLFKRMIEKAGIIIGEDEIGAALDKVAALSRSAPPVGRTDASQSKVEGETKQSPNPPLKGEGP